MNMSMRCQRTSFVAHSKFCSTGLPVDRGGNLPPFFFFFFFLFQSLYRLLIDIKIGELRLACDLRKRHDHHHPPNPPYPCSLTFVVASRLLDVLLVPWCALGCWSWLLDLGSWLFACQLWKCSGQLRAMTKYVRLGGAALFSCLFCTQVSVDDVGFRTPSLLPTYSTP